MELLWRFLQRSVDFCIVGIFTTAASYPSIEEGPALRRPFQFKHAGAYQYSAFPSILLAEVEGDQVALFAWPVFVRELMDKNSNLIFVLRSPVGSSGSS